MYILVAIPSHVQYIKIIFLITTIILRTLCIQFKEIITLVKVVWDISNKIIYFKGKKE